MLSTLKLRPPQTPNVTQPMPPLSARSSRHYRSDDCCWHHAHERYAISRPRDVTGDRCDFSTCFKPTATSVDFRFLDNNDKLHPGLGYAYYDRMCDLIDKHLELGTGDKVCFVGEMIYAGRIIPMLTERYCLVNRIVHVDPLATSSRIQDAAIGVSTSLSDTFALYYSKSRPEQFFDKIVVVDSLHCFISAASTTATASSTSATSGPGCQDHLTTTVLQLMKPLAEGGRLLLVHRTAELNTLPLPSISLCRAQSRNVPLERIVITVQSMGLELLWNVGRVPVTTSRTDWFSLIQSGFPSAAAAVAAAAATVNGGDGSSAAVRDDEVVNEDQTEGVLELTTGVMRYSGDVTAVEFVDRLAFVTISRHDEAEVKRVRRQAAAAAAAASARARADRQLLFRRPRSSHVRNITAAAAGITSVLPLTQTIPGLLDIDETSDLWKHIKERQMKNDNKPNLFR